MRLTIALLFSATLAAQIGTYPPSSSGGSPTGAAGGGLTGTYPNPGVGGFTKGVGTLTGPATSGTISPTPGANGIPQLDASGNLSIGATVLDPSLGVTSPNTAGSNISINRPSRNFADTYTSSTWQPWKSSIITTATASWESTYTGVGIDIVKDPSTSLYYMFYGGYNGTRETIGYATSPDLITWTEFASNPILPQNPTGSLPDSGGVAGPRLYYEAGTWYLYYTGLQNTGFEQGISTIMVATATAITGPWTRQGSMLAPTAVPWITSQSPGVLYSSSVFKLGSTYYMWFNGGPTAGTESIGYATATAPLGPWTAHSTATLLGSSFAGSPTALQDPEILREGDYWIMRGGCNLSGERGWYAWTTAANYPDTWTIGGVLPVGQPSLRTTIFNTKGQTFLIGVTSAASTAISIYTPQFTQIAPVLTDSKTSFVMGGGYGATVQPSQVTVTTFSTFGSVIATNSLFDGSTWSAINASYGGYAFNFSSANSTSDHFQVNRFAPGSNEGSATTVFDYEGPVSNTNPNTITLGNAATPVIFPGAVSTPASASAACVKGQVAFDASFAYFCQATNTWFRVATATW